MQRLALALTSHEATTFLLGEYGDGEHDSAVFTVADGLLWLYQAIDRNSVVRKLQVVKMRGQGQIPGLHTARITDAGYNVFPRILKPEEVVTDHPLKHRLKTGVPALDKLMAGGIPRGYSVLVAGPSGFGQDRALQSVHRRGHQARAKTGSWPCSRSDPTTTCRPRHAARSSRSWSGGRSWRSSTCVRWISRSTRPCWSFANAVKRTGAKRAVIDSLSGLELALAPTFREDFRESLYRMMGALTGLGVTVMATVELADSYVDLRFSPQGIAFLTDAIIIQRYLEIDGGLRRAMAVVKLRASQHSKELREYDITADGGITVGPALKGYQGLLTGTPALGGKTRTR